MLHSDSETKVESGRFEFVRIMTNGMVEPGRCQSNGGVAPSLLGYESFHDNLSNVFDAAFSAAASGVAHGAPRRPYDTYEFMPPPPPLQQPPTMQVINLDCLNCCRENKIGIRCR